MLRVRLQRCWQIGCASPPGSIHPLPKRQGRCGIAAPPQPHVWTQQRHAQRSRRCCGTSAAASPYSSDDEDVQTEELEDGTVVFRFGEEADSSTASAAAADVAKDAGISRGAVDAAAAAGAEATAVTDGSTGALDSATSASDDDTHTKTEAAPADAVAKNKKSAGSTTQSLDKQQLQELKVAELKEIARENDLRGYSTLRKNELVDFLADSLPGDYQI